jgi:hypothetical protein
MPEGADESGDPSCCLDVVRKEDIQIVTRPKYRVATEPLDARTFLSYASIACRSSCSRLLGERTASGFKRVNMMNVDMTTPPMVVLVE